MGRAACTRNMNQENGGDRRLRDRGRTQRNARRLLIEFAAGCLGQQHGQHLCIERVHGLRDVEVGEEIEIVDDTPVDDDRMGTVVGHQIAAVRGEMRMVFVVDMHLLPPLGCEQNGQHKGREALFVAEVHCLHGGEDTKKRDRDKRPLQKYLQMRVYVLSGTPRGKRTPPEKAGRFKC